MLIRVLAAALAALAFAGSAFAQLLTERKIFTLPQYTTVGGKTIKNVRIGYESHGRLNAAGDNAIYIAHFLTGNSHAAGRYKADDKAAGYWDNVIGPGKPFDTDRYFVLSADTLVNVNAKDTGPGSVDPATGRPYGMSFPIVTMRDFVNVQKALADSLGVKKFAAVAGPSMGSLQVMEWAAAYPDMVARAIPVVPAGLEANPYIIQTMNTWAAPIMSDPNWNGGDYYGRPEPVAGVAEALKLAVLSARHPGWADKTFGRKWAATEKNPLQDWGNHYAIEGAIDMVSHGRAGASDANAFLYLVRAIQLYQVEGVAGIKAKVLAIPAKSDLFFFPDYYTKKMVATLKAQGTHVEVFEIDGDGGHLDGIFDAAKAGETIRAFLKQ